MNSFIAADPNRRELDNQRNTKSPFGRVRPLRVSIAGFVFGLGALSQGLETMRRVVLVLWITACKQLVQLAVTARLISSFQ
jgi:hypothetical protein